MLSKFSKFEFIAFVCSSPLSSTFPQGIRLKSFPYEMRAIFCIKVEALWFGYYGVIIWFLSGKNESEWFLLFSLSDILCVICVHNFQCAFYANLLSLTSLKSKELCAWLITRYTFHAHCCVIYQRTITQDADVFWETKIWSNFPLNCPFLSFFMKSDTSTPFFYFVILKYLR